MYVKVTEQIVDKYPYTVNDLRKDNPQTSFPKTPTDSLLESYDVFKVVYLQKPVYDLDTQKLVQDRQPSLIDGVWSIGYAIVNLTQEEIDNNIKLLTKKYMDAVQEHLDTTAQERNYGGILSLCTYATSPNTTFATEGQAGVAWRDACWTYATQVLSDVNNNIRTMPTIEELIQELPTITW